MKIICVLYDESKNKVLIRKNGKEQNLFSVNCEKEDDYFILLQEHLLETVGIKVLRSDLSTIFKGEDYSVLLLNSDYSESKKHELVDLKQINTISDVDKIVLSRILNYFFRIGKIKMEPLCFSIRCERDEIIHECEKLIHRNNPGIAMVDMWESPKDNNLFHKIIYTRGTKTKFRTQVEEINLVHNVHKGDSLDNNVIDISDMSIEDIYKEVMKSISNLQQKKVIENAMFTSCSFYGVTGLTESGKSYFANYLDLEYNMWNLKIRAFIEQAKCLFDESISSLLEVMAIQLMLEFSCYHYFKDSVVIESIYSEKIHFLFSDLLRDKYKLIFIDVDENERMRRSLDSLTEFQNKDIKKKKWGIHKLRNIAEIKLDNSKTIYNSKSQLDVYFRT